LQDNASEDRDFGTTRSEIEKSGLRFWRWIRDNAWRILDLVEEDRRGLIFLSGLSIVSEITMTLVIYLCDVQ